MSYTNGLDKPSDYFNTLLYTGNGSARSITGVGFQPDWIWVKSRTTTHQHVISDSVRGTGKELRSDTTDAESSLGNITSFDSDGFSIGTRGEINNNTTSFVSWNWKAGTTTGIAGSPSITPSAYSFNSTSGFSIISYTGNNTNGATIPHGLGTAPAMIFFKNRDSAVKWVVYHHKNTSAPETDHLVLDTDGATSDDDSILNDTAPSSTLITMKTSSSVNSASTNYIAYCFAEKKGFSKFTSFTGNGSSDGTFVYLGFRASFVIIKRTDTSANWQMYDNKRDGFNGTGYPAKGNESLRPNQDHAESSATGYDIDICANGIKLRNTSSTMNSSGASHIVMAFAEFPFVTSTGIPTTAR